MVSIIPSFKEDFKIRICPYKKSDYQYIHDLHFENMKYFVDKYWGGWDSDIFKKDINSKITWIIEYEKHIAGFFVLSFREKAYLRNIQINYSYQNLGIGNYVLNQCESECLRKGYDFLYLDVFLENRVKNLYEKLGYKTYRITDSHYMMKKYLYKNIKKKL